MILLFITDVFKGFKKKIKIEKNLNNAFICLICLPLRNIGEIKIRNLNNNFISEDF